MRRCDFLLWILGALITLCVSISFIDGPVCADTFDDRVASITSELERVSSLSTSRSADRKAIIAAVENSAKFIAEVLNNPMIVDERELTVLKPVIEGLESLFEIIGSQFVDPLTNTDPLSWKDNAKNGFEYVMKWVGGQASVFAQGLLRDFIALTGIGYKPDGVRNSGFSPFPVFPMVGADAARSRTLKKALEILIKTFKEELKAESVGSPGRASQARALFSKFVFASTDAEPVATAPQHLLHMGFIFFLAECLTLNGVELWGHRTVLGADEFGALYQFAMVAAIYIRYVSSGLSVWRMYNKMAALVRGESGVLCRLGLKSFANGEPRASRRRIVDRSPVRSWEPPGPIPPPPLRGPRGLR